VKRPLYKRPRPPARDKGIFEGLIRNGICKLAPIGCPDANAGEVSKAIFSIAWEAGVKVGRGSGYESLKDEYTVIGKSRATGKARDFRVKGEEVAALIRLARVLNGGKLELGHLTEQVTSRAVQQQN